MIKEKIDVKSSSINNKGIFATVLIKKDETICFLKGKKIKINKLKKRYASGKERLDDPLQISNYEYIDLEYPYVYFNHSCSPNAGIRAKNELVALENIKKGEEITFDYSATVWEKEENESRKDWGDKYSDIKIKCYCPSKKCRKYIGDFLDLPENIKNKYLKSKILQNFIIKNYKKFNKKMRI